MIGACAGLLFAAVMLSFGRDFYMLLGGRGAVLDQYNAGTWVKSEAPASQVMTVQGGKFWEFAANESQNIMVQKIVVRDAPGGTSPLMAVLDPIAVAAEGEARIARWPGLRTLAREGKPGRFAYTVRSVAPRAADDRSQLLRTTTATFRGTRDREDARKIHDETVLVLRALNLDPDPETRPPAWDFEICKALEKHLRENYSYTLDPSPLPRGADPIEVFLFRARTGHCEYFAAAMVAMCQSVGVPARIVVFSRDERKQQDMRLDLLALGARGGRRGAAGAREVGGAEAVEEREIGRAHV